MPVKTWATNDVPTASDLNTHYRDQVISTVTSGTRPSGTEGQHIVETDTDREYVYGGAGWVEWGGYGTWTTYTPTLTQSAGVTKSVTYARYFKIGRMVTVTVNLAVTGTGSATNAVTVTLPFTAATAGLPCGTGFINDASAGGTNYPGIVFLNSTTTMDLIDTTAATAGLVLGQTGAAFAAAIASGDTVLMSCTYESST